MSDEEEKKSLLPAEQQSSFCPAYGSVTQQEGEDQEGRGDDEEGAVQTCWVSRHKILTTVVILTAWTCIGITIFLVLFLKAPALPIPPDDHELRILSLSVWGAPSSLGTQDKTERIAAVAAFVANSTEYDLVLLQDLWMRPDHETIRASLPEDRVMTRVGDLAPALCDGRVLPTSCSGLAIVSRFPILETEFKVFSVHGDFFWFDGEYEARRGIGRMRIQPARNATVDIFVTAMAASDYNFYYRQIQAKEFAQEVKNSDADYILAGSALNSDPRNSESSYQSVRESGLSNGCEAFAGQTWIQQRYCTYGQKSNSYSTGATPLIYDYIWYKAAKERSVSVEHFKVLLLKDKAGKSFSNHEAVEATVKLIN